MKEVIQLNSDGTFFRSYSTINEASRLTSLPQSNIVRACQKKAKSCGGYLWEYREDYEAGKVKIEILIPIEDFPKLKPLLMEGE